MNKLLIAWAAATLAAAAPAFAQGTAPTAGAMPTCAAGDAVVWENSRSKAYHLQGDKYFGTTKHGKYACKSAADAAGYHAAGSTSGTHHSAMSATATAAPSPAASDAATGATGSRHHHHHKSVPSPAPSAT